MAWCKVCSADVEVEEDYAQGYSCCVQCGTVLADATYATDVTFAAEGGVEGQLLAEESVRHIAGGEDAFSGQQHRGRMEISLLVDQLHIRPREDTIEASLRLYKLAVHRGFLRGRRAAQVAASCIYIICRQDKKPFLLIDFSDALRINLFVLGAVFLELCVLFSLDDHPIMTSPVDPSLYIHRYADKLRLGAKMQAVVNTSLHLTKSMKRDWMQTGRRPSGVCGAGLWLACHIHGCPRTKREIVRIVHVGIMTVARRLDEFSVTKSGTMKPQEFEATVAQMDQEERRVLESMQPKTPAEQNDEHCCLHIRDGQAHFAQGMCRECYMNYVAMSGGLPSDGAADPPAYTRGLIRKRKRRGVKGGVKKVLKMLRLGDEEEEEMDDLDTQEPAQVKADMEAILQQGELHQMASEMPEDPPEAIPGADVLGYVEPSGEVPTVSHTQLSDSEVGDLAGQNLSCVERAVANLAGQSVGAESAAITGCDPLPQPGDAVTSSLAAQQHGHRDDVSYTGLDDDMGPDGFDDPLDVLEPLDPEVLDGLVEDEGLVRKGGEGDGGGEVDTLSDVDEEDLVGYIRTEEEARLKARVWNEMFREYLEEKAFKDATREKEGEVADQGEQEPQKKKRRGRKKKDKNGAPAATALEAVRGELEARGLSKKLNYSNLEALFDEEGMGQSSQAGTDVRPRDDSRWRHGEQAEGSQHQRRGLQGFQRAAQGEFLLHLSSRRQASERTPKKRLLGLK
ncbi:unnamed protein product [Ostreobium quekettii]|uniref:Cyclin-like domain-containing protein n=1 Tax=Ostreobium quekettii TaxID=121088 RepID=A0A8S1IWN4_9CHLO|nr:unnamed protein product [Ostreobium quekettii]